MNWITEHWMLLTFLVLAWLCGGAGLLVFWHLLKKAEPHIVD